MDGDRASAGTITVSRLWVQRYRSLADLEIDLSQVTVVRGENATGKTNLYRVLMLLSRGAAGSLAQALLDEGGMPSALWAGRAPSSGNRKPAPVRMRFGATVADVSYELALGLSPAGETPERTLGLGLAMPGLHRPMSAHELSDGTLRYLSLVALLLSPRPPELLVLNEPETSLHGSLIDPLARLVDGAARRSQIVVTTHSTELASTLSELTGDPPIVLQRIDGATIVGE